MIKDNVKKFISALPAVASHYCRSRTNRKYLPAEMRSLNRVYHAYIDAMKKDALLFESQQVFSNIFRNDYNIGFHCHKKDKCSFCEKLKNMPEDLKSEQVKLSQVTHNEEKDATYKQHVIDQKERIQDADVLSTSFDLQKVLNTPHSDSMLLFHTRKYAVYNLSVYESRHKEKDTALYGAESGKRPQRCVRDCVV